jgi:hypothetical protein
MCYFLVFVINTIKDREFKIKDIGNQLVTISVNYNARRLILYYRKE